MQNIDFYNGKSLKNIPPQFNVQDPEYFTRAANIHHREQERTRKKASRMLSLIIALCIISFTTGLIIGIKFAAGSKKEIMDERTRRAVSSFGNNVKNLIKENPLKDTVNKLTTRSKLFPKKDFPYVIRIGKEFNKSNSQKIASFLSNKGHTVIISKNNNHFNIYTGPYRTSDEAQSSIKRISDYSKPDWFPEARIVKR
jgi:hypothetical protein